ncbi:MAG: FkbM family methyltransferase [Bacteroidia bacterium]|nr:FkbM family methyltransferase [Bacteroidia bacterium]
MIRQLKDIKRQIEINFFPRYHKRKYFKQLSTLNWANIKGQNIENELLLIPYLLKPGGKFIDIGANMGQYLFVAETITQAQNIYGFEPNPELIKRLKALFPKINLFQIAASNQSTKTQFKIPIFDNKEIHTRGTLKIEHNEIEETSCKILDVQLEPLDKVCKEYDIHGISLITIDVEGGEFDTVEGASNIITEQKPILIIEIEQRHHQTNIVDYLKNFENQYDYKCYYFDTQDKKLRADWKDKNILELQELDNHGRNRLYINNFIFIPNTGNNTIDSREIEQSIIKK